MRCRHCGKHLRGKRSDARYCSAKCRVWEWRYRHPERLRTASVAPEGKRPDTLYAICEVLVRGPCLTLQVVDHIYANKRAYAVGDRDPSHYIAIPERDLRDAAATVRVSNANDLE